MHCGLNAVPLANIISLLLLFVQSDGQVPVHMYRIWRFENKMVDDHWEKNFHFVITSFITSYYLFYFITRYQHETLLKFWKEVVVTLSSKSKRLFVWHSNPLKVILLCSGNLKFIYYHIDSCLKYYCLYYKYFYFRPIKFICNTLCHIFI